jgi:hypothetical protein
MAKSKLPKFDEQVFSAFMPDGTEYVGVSVEGLMDDAFDQEIEAPEKGFYVAEYKLVGVKKFRRLLKIEEVK